jgi:hypothetical protein
VLSIATLASTARAASWSSIPSGTSSEITAVEYQSDSRFWFATAQGEIFTRQPDGSFTRSFGPTNIRFNDIEFQDGGSIGFAVGAAGQVERSVNGGASWTSVNTVGQPIRVAANAAHSTFPNCTVSDPLGDVNSVRFAGNGRVWIFAEGSQMAKSEPANPANVGAAGTWIDANDIPGTDTTPYTGDDQCKINGGIYGEGLADGFFPASTPDVGYIVAASFSTVFSTTNDLATAGQKRPADAGNAGSGARDLAGDPSNPNRMWSVSPDPYGISTAHYTEDGFATSSTWAIGNSGARTFPQNGPYDVAFKSGTVLSAGDNGLILTSVDGRTFYYVDAGGPLATEPWRAVSLANAAHGAVGGVGGQLIVSSDANATPDLAPPTVTITGPSTARVGLPVTFTANAVDAGGSGIDPNGFTWTAEGSSATSTTASQTLVFTSTGTFDVGVTVHDRAGNVSTPAHLTVTVSRSAVTAPSKLPLIGGVAKKSRRYITLKVRGRYTLPPGLTQAQACHGPVVFRVRKGKKLLAKRTTTLSRTCGYAKTIRLKRSQVGRARKLTLEVAFAGNNVLAASDNKYSVRVR